MSEKSIAQKDEYFLRIVFATYNRKPTICHICENPIRSGDEVFVVCIKAKHRINRKCLNYLCTQKCKEDFLKKHTIPATQKK